MKVALVKLKHAEKTFHLIPNLVITIEQTHVAYFTIQTNIRIIVVGYYSYHITNDH